MKIKTTADLRAFLLEEMVHTAEGTREASTAKAVCNYAQQVYNTINLEMRHAHAKHKYGTASLSPVSFDGSSERQTEPVDVSGVGEGSEQYKDAGST
jgi:hypothetical protein